MPFFSVRPLYCNIFISFHVSACICFIDMSTGIYPCACVLILIIILQNPEIWVKRMFFKVQYKVSQACEIILNKFL